MQMEFKRSNVSFFTSSFIFTILFASSATIQFGAALRPLHERPLLKKYFPTHENIQSLQKGPVPPIGGSPCTHIPGTGGGHCPNLNGMNFAGSLVRAPPPPFPGTRVDFLVASADNKKYAQHQSS